MLDWPGPVYLRMAGEATTIRTRSGDRAGIGGSRVVASSADDAVAIVAAGPLVDEAVKAAELLEADGVRVRILDAWSIKPLDVDAVQAAAAAVGGRLVVVEDHRPEGGLGSAVAEALASRGQPLRLAHLAVRGTVFPAPPPQHRAAAGIDAPAIAHAALELARDDHAA
jgi:transketolase